MPLTDAIAELIGADIAAAAAALPKGQDKGADVWKLAVKKIFAGLKANGLVVIPASAIATTGGPAAQTGPAAPVNLTIT